jgi:integrase
VKRRGNNEGYLAKRKVCNQCQKITTSNDNSKLIDCQFCGNTLPDMATWFAQVTVGSNPQTGKPNRKSLYGNTRKEVFDKMQDLLNEIEKGSYTKPSHYTFGEWLDKWLEEYKKNTISEHTCESYQSLIKVHIKPAFGKIRINMLQPDHLQTFYNQKLLDGRHDGKGGLSTRMVNYLHVVISQALEKALMLGFINRNVAKMTNPPKVKNKKPCPLTEEELLKFVAEARDDRDFPAYVLVATTGLRRGELLGLQWDCVDLDKKIIVVKRQLIPHNNGLKLLETTKSKSSRRKINITDDAVRELKAHKERQDKEKEGPLGSVYQDNNMVFAKADGSYIGPSNFTKRFQRILKRAGLRKVGIHNFRHMHASLLLARGVQQKIIQERLGHSSISITLDLYSHLADNLQQQAVLSLDGLIKQKSDSGLKHHEDNNE